MRRAKQNLPLDRVDHFGRSTIRRQHAAVLGLDRGENSEPGENVTRKHIDKCDERTQWGRINIFCRTSVNVQRVLSGHGRRLYPAFWLPCTGGELPTQL